MLRVTVDDAVRAGDPVIVPVDANENVSALVPLLVEAWLGVAAGDAERVGVAEIVATSDDVGDPDAVAF